MGTTMLSLIYYVLRFICMFSRLVKTGESWDGRKMRAVTHSSDGLRGYY